MIPKKLHKLIFCVTNYNLFYSFKTSTYYKYEQLKCCKKKYHRQFLRECQLLPSISSKTHNRHCCIFWQANRCLTPCLLLEILLLHLFNVISSFFLILRQKLGEKEEKLKKCFFSSSQAPLKTGKSIFHYFQF